MTKRTYTIAMVQHHPGKLFMWVPRQSTPLKNINMHIVHLVDEKFSRLVRQPLSTVSVESVSTFNSLL
jgi:hypothetical protein